MSGIIWSPFSPSFARYASPPILVFTCFYTARWTFHNNPILAVLPQFTGLPIPIYYCQNDFVCVQTKHKALVGLYGLVGASFMWNLMEMMHVREQVPWYFPFLYQNAQWFYFWFYAFHHVRLVIDPQKVTISQFQLLLIVIFFLIVSGLIWPYAAWYNWICHFYCFGLAVEISIITTTREFRRENPTAEEEYDAFVGIVYTL